jgi:hypothetical protein
MATEVRPRTVSTRVTEEEELAIKTEAARLGTDVGSFLRRSVLHELQDGPIDASEAMLELFVRTMEASLELGEDFTVKKFRKLCAEIKSRNGARKGG